MLWKVQNVIHQVENNYDGNNLYTKLQLKCEDLIGDLDGIQRKDLEWSLKRYQDDNNNTFNTKLYWNTKRYRVDNNNNNHVDDNEDLVLVLLVY